MLQPERRVSHISAGLSPNPISGRRGGVASGRCQWNHNGTWTRPWVAPGPRLLLPPHMSILSIPNVQPAQASVPLPGRHCCPSPVESEGGTERRQTSHITGEGSGRLSQPVQWPHTTDHTRHPSAVSRPTIANCWRNTHPTLACLTDKLCLPYHIGQRIRRIE